MPCISAVHMEVKKFFLFFGTRSLGPKKYFFTKFCKFITFAIGIEEFCMRFLRNSFGNRASIGSKKFSGFKKLFARTFSFLRLFV